MRIKFSKMHGLGNDFVVIDALTRPISLTSAQLKFLADRRFGVGCDQVLLVEGTRNPDVDFGYRIYNADGGEVEQCGNGARCVARFVRATRLTDKDRIAVETGSGILQLVLEPDGQVTVNMGAPRTEPREIPFLAEREALHYTLAVADQTVEIGAVSMGNPHAVLRVDDVTQAAVDRLGPRIEAHERFPARVNVGFMEVVNRAHIRLRVYERGAGETPACGSGACAAVVVGCLQNLLDDRVSVDLPGGSLSIKWRGAGEPVWMTGPATPVFEGQIEL